MELEPGPLELLDRDAIEAAIAPSLDSTLQSDLLEAVAPVQAAAATLDGHVQDLTATAATSSSPTDDSELDGSADTFYALVDGGLGQPDTGVAASVDGASAKTGDVSTEIADAPNAGDVLNGETGGGTIVYPPPPPEPDWAKGGGTGGGAFKTTVN